jgi:BMFP domain-containing protein YqiC
VKPKPVSEATLLKQRVAELEAKLASTEPQAPVVSSDQPAKKPRRRARKA